MDSSPPTAAAGMPDGPTDRQSADAHGPPGDGTTLREAMLQAIGELSDDERERLASAEQPDDVASAWRDLIAARAAQERETTVRAELTREFESRTHAERQRPTTGLHGGAPLALPGSVAEWTSYIRSGEGTARVQQRRAQFADWLTAHPEA